MNTNELVTLLDKEYESYKTLLLDIIKEVKKAKAYNMIEIFYPSDDLYLGHGEFTSSIFHTLHRLGYEYELDCTFIGSGIYIRWSD